MVQPVVGSQRSLEFGNFGRAGMINKFNIVGWKSWRENEEQDKKNEIETNVSDDT